MDSHEFNSLPARGRIAWLMKNAELIDERIVSKTSYAVLFDATEFFVEVIYGMKKTEKQPARIISAEEVLNYYYIENDH